MIKALFVSAGILCSSAVWSFPCYFTLAKDKCWAKYDVTVNVYDAITSKNIITVSLLKDKLWIRQPFVCEKSQKLMYSAQFTPSIWDKDKGRLYLAQHIWSLPTEINPGDQAWNVSVCYPSAFSEVPVPPQGGGDCRCDFSVIPTIKPQ